MIAHSSSMSKQLCVLLPHDPSPASFRCCREGTFIQVAGHLKNFNNALHIQIHDIQAVKDHNALTCHMLEAIHVHLVHTRGSKTVIAL